MLIPSTVRSSIRSINKSRHRFRPSLFQQQYRTIKLFLYAATPSQVGSQKLANYDKFIISDPESCNLQLINPDSIVYEAQDDKKGTIAIVKPDPSYKETNLKWVLDNCIQHGTFLAKPENQQNSTQYYLQKVPDQELRGNVSFQSGLKNAPGGDASARRVKQLIFTPTHDWVFIQRQLKVAREWLEFSKRAVVEVHVSPNRKKDVIKNEEVGKFPDLYLHLRPDVIAKAMPTGSRIIIEPQTDGYEYCWVMSRNGSECKKLSNTFENKKILEKEKQTLLKDQTKNAKGR
ncbi:uncharacterized protein EAF01_011664 [Botrytis porri]|uniref:Uncharacterized protein n=1 Tax=Botrytis porri TaxID=87229 RepID=A0A4Z1K6V2_9HELO|nr:uncharacterized protein EAF01_011664 [Botrytis porri]KAF7883155.1 hypothetical protein EAF01_011664 [Botrytis porri]TGO81853.1 hypothetical protein BPOR_0994g00010 [Botrytis porri]